MTFNTKKNLLPTFSFIMFVIIIVSPYSVIAQSKWKSISIYSNGGYGKSFSVNKATKNIDGGNIYFFQLQFEYQKKYFTRLTFDQYTMPYSETNNNNGLQYQINNKMQSTNIGLDIGLQSKQRSKMMGVAYAGTGLASMQMPKITYDSMTKFTNIFNTNKSCLFLRAGAGLEYGFNKYFIACLETQYVSVINTPANLNFLSFQIGFKSLLQ
jgi:hypothetical protein